MINFHTSFQLPYTIGLVFLTFSTYSRSLSAKNLFNYSTSTTTKKVIIVASMIFPLKA